MHGPVDVNSHGADGGTRRATGAADVPMSAIGSVCGRAADLISEARVRTQIARLKPKGYSPASEDDARDMASLAYDLVLFAPDPMGRTAFDRLARRHGASLRPDERAALDLIRRARFTVMRVDGPAPDGRLRVRDLFDGSEHMLSLDLAWPGELLALRAAIDRDGELQPQGPIVRLPDDGQYVPWEQATRAGDGFRNPHRAAETIYRRMLAAAARNNDAVADWLAFLADEPGEAGPAAPGRRPPPEPRIQLSSDAPQLVHQLAAMAADWADRDLRHPETDAPDSVRWLRSVAAPDMAISATGLAAILPEGNGQQRALDTIAAIMLETAEARAAVGLDEPVAQFAADAHAAGYLRQPTLDRLNRLLAQVRAKQPTGTEDPDLDRVIARVRALHAKTRAAGCTEAEAMAAAEKAEELLRRYDITLTPEQVAQQDCVAAQVPTGYKRPGGLEDCATAIAAFCDCRSWNQRAADGYVTFVFFGLPADAAAADSLCRLILDTFEQETARFKASRTYRDTPSPDRATATRSFRVGLGDGIAEKLHELREQRTRGTRHATGRDLVPLKRDAIDQAVERLGLQFSYTKRSEPLVDPNAYDQGVASGRSFQPEPAVRNG